ncbi:MAG: hypothetical protein IJU51_06935 [Clostridia bacterium]|nr:hypothetical protein [Clostridia bacterium]
MGFQDDWVMRQIDIVARFVSSLVFKKEIVEYQPSASDMLSHTDEVYYAIMRLLKEGKICEAEDALFENIEFSDRYVELATDFYRRLNAMTDQELEAADFSRDEVYDGFIDILNQLGIPVEQFTE